MRIATSMTYELGIRSINDQTAKLLHNQQMLSTGRRIVSPSDDPVAAARALVVTQAKDINSQFAINQRNATGALSLEEAQLTSVNETLTRIRELAVQGGDGALSGTSLSSIAMELRARFDELVGVANATDGNGDYIFSGYMGSTKPFSGNVDALLAVPGSEIAYQGDSGQRRLQVSPTRFLEVSDSGNDVFKQIRNGNGSFVTGYNAANSGTAVIDAGNVTNPATWNNLPTKNYDIKFWVDTNGIAVDGLGNPAGRPGDTYYDLIDNQALLADGVTPNPNFGNSLVTGAAAVQPTVGPPPTFPPGLRKYYDNHPILLNTQPGDTNPLPFDLGSSINITGAPADGDSFTLAPSTNQSLFKTLSNLIGALENRMANPTAAGSTALTNEIGFALTNLDQVNENVLRIRAAIGSRLNEVDALGSINQDVDLRYQQTLSELQDVDYAKSISDLQQTQNGLDAAQKSFMKITQLSLFNYL